MWLQRKRKFKCSGTERTGTLRTTKDQKSIVEARARRETREVERPPDIEIPEPLTKNPQEIPKFLAASANTKVSTLQSNKKASTRKHSVDNIPKKSDELKFAEITRMDIERPRKVIHLADIGVYEGESVQNLPSGFGCLKMKNGDFYEGEFCEGAFHGQGKMVSTDGCVYEGAWYEGLRSGQGTETWSNGNKFVGEFLYDKKNGYGRPQ